MKARLGVGIRNIKEVSRARAGFPASSLHERCQVAVKIGSRLGGCGISGCNTGKLTSTSELQDNFLPGFQVCKTPRSICEYVKLTAAPIGS